MADVQIGGLVVHGCTVMRAKFSGFCNLTHTRFQAGTLIAYKGVNKLTTAEKKAIFGDGKVYALTVLWDEQANRPVSQRGGRGPARSSDIVIGKFAHPVDFEPSTYQLSILNAYLANKNAHMEIKAYAGSGKTTSLVWLVQELCRRGILPTDVVYLAFNKSIQEELAERLEGTGCPAFTTHAFGFQSLKARFGNNLQSNSGRRSMLWLHVICDDLGLDHDKSNYEKARESDQYQLREAVKELVGLVKNWAIKPVWNGKVWKFGEAQVKQTLELIKTYEIEFNGELVINGKKVDAAMIADYALRVVVASIPEPNGTLSSVDYDDMLYLPRVLNLPLPKKNLVLTDESQDFNACQIEMLETMVKNGATVIFVGDPNQALYHFRGADSRAFERIGEMLTRHGVLVRQCLPKTWRSAMRIVENARRWVPDFEGERKELGVVDTISFGKMLTRLNNNQTDIELPDGVDGALRSLPDDSMTKKRQGCTFGVLCRINLPLFVTAYQCLGHRLRVQIIGKAQIGEPLKRLIKELCGDDPQDPNYTNLIGDKIDPQSKKVLERGLLTRLQDYVMIQNQKLVAEGYEKKVEKLRQDAACIEVISMNVADNCVSSVIREIDTLVSDDPDPAAIQFSTIHRAKGLEWNVVFILRPDLMPHPYAQPNEDGSESEDQIVEKNCCYVGGTRPKDRLYYVSTWPFGNCSNKALAFERPDDGLSCGETDDEDEEVSVGGGRERGRWSELSSTLGLVDESATVRDMIEAEGGDGQPVGPVLTQEVWDAYQAAHPNPAQSAQPKKPEPPKPTTVFTDDGQPF